MSIDDTCIELITGISSEAAIAQFHGEVLAPDRKAYMDGYIQGIRDLSEKLQSNDIKPVPECDCALECSNEPVNEPVMYLHYSNSAKETLMKIAQVTSDGCIFISGKDNSERISKKYNMRSLKWIQNMLPSWSKKQKMETHFWEKIAAKYSKKFLEGDKISRTTVEKLCYLVDSGEMEIWFNLWNHLRNKDEQIKLDI